MNHTSDQSPWSKESRSSRTNPKRDWYIWRDGKGPGIPPNNWESDFGGSAWTYDPTTKQWYYHKFLPAQPDLNWRNPAVEKAMFNAYRSWLNKGVAGFRLDAIPELFEDPQLRNEKILPGTKGSEEKCGFETHGAATIRGLCRYSAIDPSSQSPADASSEMNAA